MRLVLSVSLALFALSMLPKGASAVKPEPSLAGVWEVQTMGADREVRIRQKGNRIIAERVLWPEFEGKKYKLEHRYQGKLQGGKLDGQLLVREEGIPDFEVLRPFTGAVKADGQFVLDGLPMRRKGKGDAAQADAAPTEDRPNPAPTLE